MTFDDLKAGEDFRFLLRSIGPTRVYRKCGPDTYEPVEERKPLTIHSTDNAREVTRVGA